jgi:polyadenylate-binding protein
MTSLLDDQHPKRRQSKKRTLTNESFSLWVGNLDKNVTEHELYETFSAVGAISSVRVCADAVLRCSLGYGYVNFVEPKMAQKALDIKNYEELQGRPMRIMWSQRDPNMRRSAVGNIFIKNLHKNIDARSLHDSLSQFGPILSCKIASDKDGESKGYGFVHFECEEDAKECIAQVNGREIEGKEVAVGLFLPRSERLNDREFRYTNVFVKNLPEDVSDTELASLFEPHGSITSAIVMKDINGSSKKFGFVNFSKPEEAQSAVQLKDKYMLDGKELGVFRAQKKAERAPTLSRFFQDRKREQVAKYHGLNLYVKNFPLDCDEQKLRMQFSEFGTVTSCIIIRDTSTNRSKGFGFVCFSNAIEARRALSEMKTRPYSGKPLYVSLAQTKEARRKQLEMQFRIRTSSQHTIESLGLVPSLSGSLMRMPPDCTVQQRLLGHIGKSQTSNLNTPRGDCKPKLSAGFCYTYGRSHRKVMSRGKTGCCRQSSQINSRRRIDKRGTELQASIEDLATKRLETPQESSNDDLSFAPQTRDGAQRMRSPLQSGFKALDKLSDKQKIGEEIYPLVHRYLLAGRTTVPSLEPTLAGKITGMFLDLELGELRGLLGNRARLAENIEAAVQVLRKTNHGTENEHKESVFELSEEKSSKKLYEVNST